MVGYGCDLCIWDACAVKEAAAKPNDQATVFKVRMWIGKE